MAIPGPFVRPFNDAMKRNLYVNIMTDGVCLDPAVETNENDSLFI